MEALHIPSGALQAGVTSDLHMPSVEWHHLILLTEIPLMTLIIIIIMKN